MTVNDINQKEFTIAKRGYEQDEVRQFMHQVAQHVHALEAEKINLIKKLEVLAHRIEEYKKDEQNIQAALLGAQKLASSTIAEAEQQAKKTTAEINQKASEIMTKAKTESDRMMSEAKEHSTTLLTKAKTEAERSMQEAKTMVEKTLQESRYEIEKEQATLLRVQKEVSVFKKGLLDVYRSHIDLIQRLPETEEAKEADEKEMRELKNNLYKQQSEGTKATVTEDATQAMAQSAEDTSTGESATSGASGEDNAVATQDNETAQETENRFVSLHFQDKK